MNKLAKNYDKLSPSERFALIVAATARDDEVERATLVSSAPKLGFRVVDFYGLANAFERLAMAHVLDALNLGCILLWVSHLGEGDGDTWELVEKLAGEYLAHREAWRLFCEENNVNPDDILTPDYPGVEVLALVNKLAEGVAPDDPDPGEYLTALRSGLAGLAKAWS